MALAPIEPSFDAILRLLTVLAPLVVSFETFVVAVTLASASIAAELVRGIDQFATNQIGEV